MKPSEYYRELGLQKKMKADEQQKLALIHLDKLYLDLVQENIRRRSFFSYLRNKKMIRGIYMWGKVGIGKTFLMDCFYHCIPFKEKKRMHFHQFMRWIHSELKHHQGKKNPLRFIAKTIAKDTQVLCFDELVVNDIVDAMILRHVFSALFQVGICLIATSNTTPDHLYKNGLQRALFLPAIQLLKENLSVLHLTTHDDYRVGYLKSAGISYVPNDKIAQQKMQDTFTIFCGANKINFAPIKINGRFIPVIKSTDNIVWFEFTDICSPPRSQHDYLVIAEIYKTVFISNIPLIKPEAKDTICLFITLVDVFYDARIRLVFSAASAVDKIYQQGHKIIDFARTHSRLIEMQSEDYWIFRS